MKGSLTQRQHAGVALAILCGAIALLIIIALPALASRNAFRDRLGELHLQYQRYSAVAADTPRLKIELDDLRSRTVDQTGFLEEQSPALAGAALQKKLKELIEANGGSLISAQVASAAKDGIYPSITVKVQMRGDIGNLRGILHDLATNPMLLRLDDMLIQSRHAGGGQRRQRTTEALEVRFDVSAFIYQDATS